ncbi:hypothetical protein [Methylobacterium radiodurans]|uniref:Uncharacterized protein n=1 Tax=Methylobacterium radiodurans TaxID=2202828 RepID=A0A2U8VP91_9HYPH|nr:hypothetical protein [Methylobacterium radiodurans]AWN35427.1 hypothetical protein DK427_06540 [Methylobacterium radiodurans]
MCKPSVTAEEQIAIQREALRGILDTLQNLDPEMTSHAEMERCKKVITRLRAAVKALEAPEIFAAPTEASVNVLADAITAKRLSIVRQQEEQRERPEPAPRR